MTTESRIPSGVGDALTGDVVLRSHEMAEFAGTTPRALRHYHKIGLLPEVPRDPNGYRRYRARDLVRVLRIRQLAATGMPLRKIGNVLEHDTLIQDELLAELDRELKEQVERIEAQRMMIAELRRLSVRPERFSTFEHPTTTQQLDQDVWTLITASGRLNAYTAATMLNALQGEPLAERVAAWYPAFEQLEQQTQIDEASADRLAEQLASFVDAVMEGTEISPSEEEQPVKALVEQMQSEALSPAQQEVWGRFISIIQKQWTSRPKFDDIGNDARPE